MEGYTLFFDKNSLKRGFTRLVKKWYIIEKYEHNTNKIYFITLGWKIPQIKSHSVKPKRSA
ncbi:hypothetical protein BSK60_29895 [Paenibacillus odorifer]|uniref:Uncharacterized protein n=1 Tax=Paenibacillus odorifer TaxID=189426 RepID=A0AB36J601_9BACL|nr:hypothetical protein BSK60_29895 [Paenibacillus odorifer]OME12444.1 hypothetical protein BSK47_26860 [Paenibacillus odorifer]